MAFGAPVLVGFGAALLIGAAVSEFGVENVIEGFELRPQPPVTPIAPPPLENPPR